jgi:hypothetical protein
MLSTEYLAMVFSYKVILVIHTIEEIYLTYTIIFILSMTVILFLFKKDKIIKKGKMPFKHYK